MSKRSTWVAWSLLGAYTAGIGTTAVLAIADGRLQRDWQGLIAQTLAFATYGVIGALDTWPRRPAQRHGLGLLSDCAGFVPHPVGDALADHDAGEVGVRAGDGRHDRGIHHPQILDRPDPAVLVDDRHRIVRRSHRGGAAGMELG